MRKSFIVSLMLVFVHVSFGQLSGPLSGTLGPGTYHVDGAISVNSGDSLRLMPGTTLIFDGPYSFTINGTLLAEGAVSDSIRFTTEQSDLNRWRGLRFEGVGSSGSQLRFCLIEKGYATGTAPDNRGGGVYCYDYASPAFTNCTISDNRADGAGAYGGGVACYSYSSPTFVNCSFNRNEAGVGSGGYGGGLFIYGSSPTFVNCVIDSNSSRYEGGGIYCDHSMATFTSCTIVGNSSAGGRGGGGVCCYTEGSGVFTNCIINRNTGKGGGVYCERSSPCFINCTMSGNAGGSYGAVYLYSCDGYSPVFYNTIIAFSTGTGINFDESEAQNCFEYCDIFGNATTFGGNLPPGLGQLIMTNENGDSCDVYFNIFCDPMFEDTANDDYHLTASSCCIDAGNPCQLDSDTTVSDVGRYYFHHTMPDYDTTKAIYLCYSVEETGRYVSWRPFANSTGYKLYRTMQVELPIEEWDLLDTMTPDIWDYLDTEAFNPTKRYFYQVKVLY
ncbi:right-handed parallel beta-helix repeat-containing protein [bacterium]|nr:right-handed parallel beta-helix repeat-containing protein [bacterium]